MSTEPSPPFQLPEDELDTVRTDAADKALTDLGVEESAELDDDYELAIPSDVYGEFEGAPGLQGAAAGDSEIQAEIIAISHAIAGTFRNLAQDNEKLARDRDKFIDYANALEKRHLATLNSTSWKITAPVRFGKKVFDRIFLRRRTKARKPLVRPGS